MFVKNRVFIRSKIILLNLAVKPNKKISIRKVKSMHKIKGLLTDIKGSEEASIMILPFNKRIEEYLKIMKRINQIYDRIFVDPFASFVLQLSNLNKSTLDDTKTYKNKPESYSFIFEVFSDVQKIIKATNHQIRSYSNDGFKAIVDQCQQIKKICDVLSQKLNSHQSKQKDLNQNIKKYSKNHKNFLQAMQSYKMAFQDVKLIYNIEEKTKRYKVCSSFFTATVSDLEEIDQTIKVLTDERSDLKGILQKFRAKSLQFIRIVSQEMIKIPQNILKCYIKSNKELFKLLEEKIKAFKEKKTKSFFQKFRLPFPNPEFFECELKQSENALYPSFLVNLKSMKAEHFGKCKKFLVEYYISIREDIKQRSQMNDKLKNYFTILNGLFEKMFISEQKEIKELMNDKYMKLVQAHFVESQQSSAGSQCLKISEIIQKMAEFLDENRQLTKNMNKIYSQHVKQIIQGVDEENKTILFFKDEFKNKFYSLFAGKKEFKKDMETLKSGEIQSLTLSQDEVKEMRSEILKKSEFILLLINGFTEKFRISSGKIKSFLDSLLDDYAKHQSYEKDLYEKYKQTFEDFTTILIKKRLQQPENEKIQGFWLDENSLYKAVVIQKVKIKFDSQIDKVNEFKKVKKPTENFDENSLSSSGQKVKQASPAKKEVNESTSKSFGKNYELFVQQNTNFEEGQKYVSNYACGLCDNIIISGRLYLTTHRLFFHSRFNSSNIFFGETKLQIPRSDIKKIEKKYNAIIFDNSISITTINGEIFFTSFVSRDTAYDLICKTFDINIDEEVFITEEVHADVQGQEETENFNLTIEQEDDMPEGDLEERARQIDEMLQKDEASDEKAQQISYQNVSSQDFTFMALNAAKMFKIFESGQEMPYKNKTYESFWHYFKGHIHKNEEMTVQNWQPNILDYLNPSNIKKDTPLKFTRKITTNVPAPQTSIPFMPKFIESDETHELYFYSKDKYVIILKVKNSKAPYTDSFYLRYRKVVETKGENTVRIESNLKIVFIKKTMVQGMIQSRTTKESIENNKSMTDEMQKYLKYLENTLLKKNSKKDDKIQDMSTTDGGILDETRNLDESQILVSQNIELKKKLESANLQNSIFKKVLSVSLIFNFVLLLWALYGTSSNEDL